MDRALCLSGCACNLVYKQRDTRGKWEVKTHCFKELLREAHLHGVFIFKRGRDGQTGGKLSKDEGEAIWENVLRSVKSYVTGMTKREGEPDRQEHKE